jgi:hypothetical protein
VERVGFPGKVSMFESEQLRLKQSYLKDLIVFLALNGI